MEQPTVRVAAAWVTDADDRVLLVRKRGTDAFMQPGGKPEAGETPERALVRELDEQLGWTVHPDELDPWGSSTPTRPTSPGTRWSPSCGGTAAGTSGR